jgi:hypothetical protein
MFGISKGYIALGLAVAWLSSIGLVFIYAKSIGASQAEISAMSNAVKRVTEMEKNNEAFKRMDERHRCIWIMRLSELPDESCG